jgi:hypothetical protein
VVCSTADNWCSEEILEPLAANWDIYYVPTANPDPYPPPLEPYLQSSAVTSKIGSQSTWEMSNLEVYLQFSATGDLARSSLPNLEMVINSGVRTVVYDGDADFICNYIGAEAMVRQSLIYSSPSSSHCANPVVTCAGWLLKHEFLGRVREPELHDLYRQR